MPVSAARFATNGSGLTTLPAAITPSGNTFTAFSWEKTDKADELRAAAGLGAPERTVA